MTKRIADKTGQFSGLPGYIIHALWNAGIETHIDLQFVMVCLHKHIPGIGKKGEGRIWRWLAEKEEQLD